MGIVIGLIAAAIGVLVALAGGPVGLGVRLLVIPFGLLAHPIPIILIAVGIIWLVKGSNHGNLPVARICHGHRAPPPGPRPL
jgi:hypothetical protein